MSFHCLETMALFQSQSITMETKVSKAQSELGLKPSISISLMKPPSKTGLESSEVYNPWPEFDMQTKRKGIVSCHYSPKDQIVSQGLDLVRETKEAVQFNDTRQNEPPLIKRLPASKPLSLPETEKSQKKSTYNPNKMTSVMVKTHEQNCSKQNKNQKRSKTSSHN